MNTEQRIRRIAASKIKVRITKRTRSKGGFYVWTPFYPATYCKTKREALQMLLAQTRCVRDLEFYITPKPPKPLHHLT